MQILFKRYKICSLLHFYIRVLGKFYEVVVVKHKFRLTFQDIKQYIDKFKLMKNREGGYSYWIQRNILTKEIIEEQKQQVFPYQPLISIITPTYNTPAKILDEMIQSVLNQTYTNWELCIADGNSLQQTIERLRYYQALDTRIKVSYLDVNKGIVGNSNEAIRIANGDYLALLDHDDLLEPNALFEVVKCINTSDADFIYTDEDKITEDGKERFDPFFKPDWSPDLLRGHNYITHFAVIKKQLLDNIGWFREGYEGSQDYDLFLRITEKTKKIAHIPKILYHWRANENSVALNPHVKTYAYISGQKALEAHLKRVGLSGKVEFGPCIGTYRIKYDLTGNPLVSIIIPNKDHIEDLKKCLNSIHSKSTYTNYEIIVVENNSEKPETFNYYNEIEKRLNVNVIKWGKEFNFSAINNYAVQYASGELLLFLNNDTEIINANWLEEMIVYAQREDVGVVGAKLYYPDNTIQHGGVIIGIGETAGHSHKGFDRDSIGYYFKLILPQNFSAVTGACLMISKKIFEEVNGFDERFKVAFNDVDLCLKVRSLDKLIVWTPFAELYHYESKSRGYEDTPERLARFVNEKNMLRNKWSDIYEKGDPYYNQNLTLDREDFSFKI